MLIRTASKYNPFLSFISYHPSSPRSLKGCDVRLRGEAGRVQISLLSKHRWSYRLDCSLWWLPLWLKRWISATKHWGWIESQVRGFSRPKSIFWYNGAKGAGSFPAQPGVQQVLGFFVSQKIGQAVCGGPSDAIAYLPFL